MRYIGYLPAGSRVDMQFNPHGNYGAFRGENAAMLHLGSARISFNRALIIENLYMALPSNELNINWSVGDQVTVKISFNSAPTASNSEVLTEKNADYIFTASDFQFSDVDTQDGQSLESVTIVTLPASGKGALTLNGTAVNAGASVTRADIDGGNLKYTPPADESGDNFASFTYSFIKGSPTLSSWCAHRAE